MPLPAGSTGSLQSVDNLKITFLVDNCVEWMTKFPPGFSSEIREHLSANPPIDDLTNTPIVDLENYCCGAHGFSALIETQVSGSKEHLTLFDTGPDSRSLVRNIRSLNVPADHIDEIILSHWHADHSGGLLSFLSMRGSSAPPCTVDLHPSRPIARGIAPPPTYKKVIARLPADPTFDAIEKTGGIVATSREGHAIAGGTVWVSGEIPRTTEFEGGLLGGVRWLETENGGKGGWKNVEHIMDERYVCIDVAGKGLVLFSACSHAGIVNVIKDAINNFSRPVYMVIGGLHLAGPELAYRIKPTTDFLSMRMRPSPTYVLPMHCSGFNCKVALQEALGEACVPAGVGMKVTVEGDRSLDDRLPPSSWY
ncbi:hypothetical protein HWV62_37001 [Athelia sp. TMB]|nr:hypothetical protein HWV62_37001 [Athelia sp. TMB]